MDEEMIVFNGVNGVTGDYISPPMTIGEVARMAQGEEEEKGVVSFLKNWWDRIKTHLDFHYDPLNLEEAGWGVIFHRDEQDEVKKALAALVEQRKGRTFEYMPGESKTDFLVRHGGSTGPPDPAQIPYYLLVVGPPTAIPFKFQYQLDVQYAVGRLAFDTPADYRRYAESVVDCEQRAEAPTAKKVLFFSPRNPDDMATALSTDEMVGPLAEWLPQARLTKDGQQYPVWPGGISLLSAEQATRANLLKSLGQETPALLFSASHGMEFPSEHRLQHSDQGALLCQEWPGPREWRGKPIPDSMYLAGRHLDDSARVQGMVAFHFACYGAGTPHLDDFAHQRATLQRRVLAPEPFVAALPQRLLAHPNGSALAVIGHVERAWGCSFLWDGAGAQLQTFKYTVEALLQGHPVGHAVGAFNRRYAELSTLLNDELEQIKFNTQVQVDDRHLAGMWTAQNDARSYVVLGDPAVRLRLE
jgi:hypothetical protein